MPTLITKCLLYNANTKNLGITANGSAVKEYCTLKYKLGKLGNRN